MKNRFKYSLILVAALTATYQAKAADVLSGAIGTALKGAAMSPGYGCGTLGTLGGRYLSTMLVSPENRAVAQVVCCEEPGFKQNHPNAYKSLCEGTSTSKATETLINKVDLAPQYSCPALAQLGRGLGSLTNAQKAKVYGTCVKSGTNYFAKHPKALAAVTPAETSEEEEENE